MFMRDTDSQSEPIGRSQRLDPRICFLGRFAACVDRLDEVLADTFSLDDQARRGDRIDRQLDRAAGTSLVGDDVDRNAAPRDQLVRSPYPRSLSSPTFPPVESRSARLDRQRSLEYRSNLLTERSNRRRGSTRSKARTGSRSSPYRRRRPSAPDASPTTRSLQRRNAAASIRRRRASGRCPRDARSLDPPDRQARGQVRHTELKQ